MAAGQRHVDAYSVESLHSSPSSSSQIGDEDRIHSEAVSRNLHRMGSRTMDWDRSYEDFRRNWPVPRKVYDDLSAMTEYGLSRVVSLTGYQFMYGMGQAFGAVIMPPFSEALGRRLSYLISAGTYVVACNLTGAVLSPAGVFLGRIEDQYRSRPRLWFLWLWNCCTMLGLATGPIYGSYIADAIGWRWIYHTGAITSAVVFALMLPVRESRPTTLLVCHMKMDISSQDRIRNTHGLVQTIIIRPTKLGVTKPIMILVAILSASAWGMLYLFTESFVVVYSGFGLSLRATSLPFLALIPGIITSNLCRHWDYHRLKNSMFGVPLIGFAATEFSYTLSRYLADAYTVYAGSAMAASSVLKAVASGCLPLFAYPMYSGLGSNVATSIIAALATVYSITLWVFVKYGLKLREKSLFARYSAEISDG
ncbi:major facilitator superfamily domain-containing protein [Aspergillus spinulosporus]